MLHHAASSNVPPASRPAHAEESHMRLLIPIPFYLRTYPQITDAALACRDLVDQWSEPTVEGEHELEVRLGTLNSQGFVAGVSPTFIDGVVGQLESFPQWTKVEDWYTTHDYFYFVPTSEVKSSPQLEKFINETRTQQLLVRTTATFVQEMNWPLHHNTTSSTLATSGVANNSKIQVTHRTKMILAKRDFQYVPHASEPPKELPTHAYDLRVTLNYEYTIDDQYLNYIINPHYVRIKTRKSYYYKSQNSNHHEPMWKIDVTKSWSGATLSEAECKQRSENPIYEIELECLNPQTLMKAVKQEAIYVISSLLMKVLDFFVYTHHDCQFKWLEPV
jgi:hypothetical protein